MSPIRNNVRRQRRISSLLSSLLSRVRGWLDGWLKHRRSACSTIQAQPRHRSTLHFEALKPRLLLPADLAAGPLTHDALLPLVPGGPISALFEVHRADDEELAEPVRIAFYASADGVIDPDNAIVESIESNNQALALASQPFLSLPRKSWGRLGV